jgi:hypothetical protein
MPKVVSGWRCKCGVSITVVSDTATEELSDPVSIACPKCGDVQTMDAATIISITAERAGHAGFIAY